MSTPRQSEREAILTQIALYGQAISLGDLDEATRIYDELSASLRREEQGEARDAARYRFLRAHFVDVLFGDKSGRPFAVRGDGEFGDEKDGLRLDRMIDALQSNGEQQ